MDTRKWMYHPEHGGKIFPDAVAAKAAEVEGWFDTPAKFPSVAPHPQKDEERLALEAEAAALNLTFKDSWSNQVFKMQIAKARKNSGTAQE